MLASSYIINYVQIYNLLASSNLNRYIFIYILREKERESRERESESGKHESKRWDQLAG